MEVLILFVLAFICLAFMVHFFAQEQCPKCQQRGTVKWNYANKNGGPDLRYSNNFKTCRHCGWRSK